MQFPNPPPVGQPAVPQQGFPQQAPQPQPGFPQAAPGAVPPQQGFPQPVPQAQPPGTAPTGMFSGIGQAQASVDANYIRPGHYVARIDRAKVGSNQQGQAFLAMEMTILAVLSAQEAEVVGVKPHVVGESPTDMKMKHHRPFLGSVKKMIASIEGCAPEELDGKFQQHGTTLEAFCEMVCSDQQPYAGTVVELYVRQIRTQPKAGSPNGNPFTKVEYRREVRPSELASILDPDVLQSQYGNGLLEQMIAQEQQVHQGQPPAAQ